MQVVKEEKGKLYSIPTKEVGGFVSSDLAIKILKALAKKLKRSCGSGGTVKNGMIEIQGEHRDKISDVLGELGYKVKISGG